MQFKNKDFNQIKYLRTGVRFFFNILFPFKKPGLALNLRLMVTQSITSLLSYQALAVSRPGCILALLLVERGVEGGLDMIHGLGSFLSRR